MTLYDLYNTSVRRVQYYEKYLYQQYWVSTFEPHPTQCTSSMLLIHPLLIHPVLLQHTHWQIIAREASQVEHDHIVYVKLNYLAVR